MSTRTTLRSVLRRLTADERGATAIEYALIAGGISIAISVVVFGAGSSLKANFFNRVLNAF